jgi:DNA-directed RNA polymerase specialized sigma24 family protein
MSGPSLRAPASQAAQRSPSGIQGFLDELLRAIRSDEKSHGPFPGFAAEDVAHQAIVLCLDPKRLAAITCRSVRAKAAKRRQRGRLNEERLGDRILLDRGADPSEEAARAERDRLLRERVATEIGRLPAGLRRVILHRFWDDLTFAEIAKRLALRNRQAAYRRYERGLEMLGPALQPVWRASPAGSA